MPKETFPIGDEKELPRLSVRWQREQRAKSAGAASRDVEDEADEDDDDDADLSSRLFVDGE